MKIILAEHYGMCFGVRDALRQAHALAKSGPLTILGELVHNPVALERLAGEGVQLGDLQSFGSAAPGSRVLVTAHGASDERRSAWKAAGFELHDTTCPLVRKAHSQLAAFVAAGYFPVVIGRADHAEVRGLTGDFPGAAVLEAPEEAAALPDHPRYGVVSQTTQTSDRVERSLAALRRAKPGAEVCYRDTVCQPTRDRQLSLQRLLAAAEVIIVVGGRSSNNTRQLLLAAETAGRRAYQIERPEELDPQWLSDVSTVGLTAGTSTLPETVAAVYELLQGISAAA